MATHPGRVSGVVAFDLMVRDVETMLVVWRAEYQQAKQSGSKPGYASYAHGVIGGLEMALEQAKDRRHWLQRMKEIKKDNGS